MTDPLDRRTFIGILGALGVAGIAGCAEETPEGDDQIGEEEPAEEGTPEDETPTEEETPEDGTPEDETPTEDGTPADDDDDGAATDGAAEVDEWLSDANEYDGQVEDHTGEDMVAVEVGGGADGLAFVPPAIQIDPGTAVTWEWTGEGGMHNVVHEDGEFESELQEEAGATFEHSFEEEGSYPYFCEPHREVGMKGAVVVGGEAGGGDGGDTGGGN